MERLHFLLRHFDTIKVFTFRALSGLLPVAISFVLPLITSVEFSSTYFQKFSQVIILSSILKLGLDQTVLKSELSSNKLKNILLLILILHTTIIFILFVLSISLISTVIGSLFVSINFIMSSYFLTNDFKFKAILFQFIIPNMLIVILSTFKLDPISIISFSYAPILLTSFSKELFVFSYELKVLLQSLLNNNLYLVGYNVLGILVMYAPVALSDYFISDSDVVLLYRMLKVFSLSSFISMILIFTFNNRIREHKSSKLFFKYLLYFLPLILIISTSLLFVKEFNIFSLDMNYIHIIIISLIIYLILAGNIAGHLMILKSKEKSLLVVMVVTLIVTMTIFIILGNYSVLYLFAFYVITTFLESVLKIKFVWSLR